MKVLKTINPRGRLRINQLKDTNENITEEKREQKRLREKAGRGSAMAPQEGNVHEWTTKG